MGLADLAIFSLFRETPMSVIFYDDEFEGHPEQRSLLTIMNQILSAVPGTSQLSLPEQDGAKGSAQWIVAACRSDYERGQFWSLNHFMPVFGRADLGDSWDEECKLVQDTKPNLIHNQSKIIIDIN